MSPPNSLPTSHQLLLRSPWAVRQAVVVGQSARNRLGRYGRDYHQALHTARSLEFAPEAEHRTHQAHTLRRLLEEARTGTEYYGDLLAGFSSEMLDDMCREVDLSQLPVLPKSALRQGTKSFFNKNRRPYVRSATSGSTGSPMTVEYDRPSIQQRFAQFHRHRSWGGVGPLERSVRLSGRQIAPSDQQGGRVWASAPFEHMLLVSTYHLREPMLDDILRRIQQWRPAVIDGYPTAIAQVAQLSLDTGQRVPGLRMVITTAETLTPDQRKLIENGLGSRVFDYYSASEGVPFICQCEYGTYHVCVDSGIVEVLNADGAPTGPGEIGEVVATSFCQWRTPLIRYRTGDMVTLQAPASEPCPCGRTLPAVDGVVGRIEDLVHTRDGRKIGMFAYRTLKYVPGLREAQIVQHGYEQYTLRASLDGTRSIEAVGADTARIFTQVLGYAVTVDVEVVDVIERGAHGKQRAVVSEVGRLPKA